ncbi:hypothetical protein [Pseudomonas fluorescens]|uniref:Uncharacterized protein n=1 Tax=Pseudomonas fluorescens TaxID=294 RepID=A0A5E7BQF6_PSEFL|nr:hypothetical protein [Pseudomonas fluorescens]VVN93935.1 hypothetical protein PS723_02096 [Pseudomonas fluorescens]
MNAKRLLQGAPLEQAPLGDWIRRYKETPIITRIIIAVDLNNTITKKLKLVNFVQKFCYGCFTLHSAFFLLGQFCSVFSAGINAHKVVGGKPPLSGRRSTRPGKV